jgi:hypothetical protein
METLELTHMTIFIIGVILGSLSGIFSTLIVRWQLDRRAMELADCDRCGRKKYVMDMYVHSGGYGVENKSQVLCKKCYQDKCGGGSGLVIGA